MESERVAAIEPATSGLDQSLDRRAVVRLLGATLLGAGGLAAFAAPAVEARKRAARASMRRRRHRRGHGRHRGRRTGGGNGTGGGTQPPGRTTVTRTFHGTANLVFPEATSGESHLDFLDVSGLTDGVIEDIDLTLHGLTHTYPQDLRVYLGSPDQPGAWTIAVMAGVGGDANAANIDVTFDDEASAVLTDVTPLQPGTYQPSIGTGAITGDPPRLALFDGLDPNGTWTLLVVDDRAQDGGSLTGWSLTITASVADR